MAKESGAADVVIVPKFNMHRHESKMTGKDVKLLSRKYNILLDLHPCAPMEGWTMDELPDDHMGLVNKAIGSLSKNERGNRRAIPNAMAWRHHDSDVYDVFPNNDLSTQDVQRLTERVIDVRLIPKGMVIYVILADVHIDLSIFFLLTSYLFVVLLVSVVTMSEYLRFLFLSGASITRGATVPANHPREVETEDAKVVAAREKKKAQAAKAAAKKKDNKKRKDGAEGSSRAKRKRVSVGTKDATASSSHISSPTPLQTVAPVSQVAQRQHEDRETHAPNDEGHSVSPSPRGSANDSVNHFTNVEENQGEESLPRMEPLVILSGQPTHPPKELVFATGVNVGGSLRLPNTLSTGVPESQPRTILTGRHVEEGESSWNASVYLPRWNIPRRCRMDTPKWCWELMTHLAPPAA
ncbi:hypothetical protein Tco_0995081 [Tanacetum coccineum]